MDAPGTGRWVTSPTAPPVRLRVRERGVQEHGSPAHVVLVHGFPDDQRMWEPVVDRLDPSWHVVTYDVRGSGDSERPGARGDYRCSKLVEDLIAVVEATVPEGERFHLVAHDWGSIAMWDVVAAETWDRRLHGRVASYTSCSGPSLDHLADLSAEPGHRRQTLRQGLHSWYVWFFQLPRLPELVWRNQAILRRLHRAIAPDTPLDEWRESGSRNAVSAVNLYRANILQRLRQRVPWRSEVPVQVVVAEQDPYVLPATARGMHARCADLTEVSIETGHWVPHTHPDEFARLVTDFIRRHQHP